MAETFILPQLTDRESAINRISRFLAQLPAGRPWRVTVEPHKLTRTLPQNAYLWAIYGKILSVGGEAMGGWTKDDLHDFFLIHCFGSEVKELFGKKRHVPLRRSSSLNKQEFTDFVESIMRFMAEQGVYIPSPEEMQ